MIPVTLMFEFRWPLYCFRTDRLGYKRQDDHGNGVLLCCIVQCP